MGKRMTEQRRRDNRASSLKQRLLDRVRSLRDEGNSMNPALERETALKRAETAAQMNGSTRSTDRLD